MNTYIDAQIFTIKATSLWEANFIELVIGADNNKQQTLWELTLPEAKELREKLNVAIKRYEDEEEE